MKDIDKAIDEVEKDRSIFVLIITGVEKAFIAGADIVIPGEMNADEFAKLNSGRQTKNEAVKAYERLDSSLRAEAKDREEKLYLSKPSCIGWDDSG